MPLSRSGSRWPSLPLAWLTRRVIHRDPGASAPSRLRRALAAAWIFFVLAMLPLAALGLMASTLDAFDLSDPSVRGLIDAALDAARVLIVVNALARGMLAPGLAAWRLVPMTDRTASIVYRAAMAIAAIWAAERLIEPAADAVASLNIAVAGRGGRRDPRFARDRLRAAPARRAQPARAAGSPQADPWTPQGRSAGRSRSSFSPPR